jgi:hypothetical protein
MRLKILTGVLAGMIFSACQLSLDSPSLLRSYRTPASAREVALFSRRVTTKSPLLSLETIGESINGQPIVAIKASDPRSDNNPKLKVMIFAQQHGNEQSGKEAILLLLSEIAQRQNVQWLQQMELWIIPQLNPDGADENNRRNAAGIDLNRDHVLLQAPETRALHAVFHRELPHVTIDLHEYQPYTEAWREFGAYKNFDMQVGIPTNLNVDQRIRRFALEEALPAVENHLYSKGFSFHNYLVGPVPDNGPTRYSTVDIDDGRQSFAILNTLSFIYEGQNGRENVTDNLEKRTFAQYEALVAMLNFLQQKASETRLMINEARDRLHHASSGELVVIRKDHFQGQEPLFLNMVSSVTGSDTLVIIDDYRPVVRPILEIPRPEAYLIPKNDTMLMAFLDLHKLQYHEQFNLKDKNVFAWYVYSVSENIVEELPTLLPEVRRQEVESKNFSRDYVMIPTNQLHSNFMVLLFEPRSMLGLPQRPGFEYLLELRREYPILRVEQPYNH